MTCTTILLRSLAGPGSAYTLPHTFLTSLTFFFSGAFDTPKAKCPPDRGSSECVTGIPAPLTPNLSISSSPESYYTSAYPKQHTYVRGSFPFPKTSVGPCAIPARTSSGSSESSTPPLTPDDGSDCSDRSISPSLMQQKDAMDFLMTLFPTGLGALPYAKSISISAPNMGSAFNGMVLELPGKPRTLYVDAKNAESVSLRERYVLYLLSTIMSYVLPRVDSIISVFFIASSHFWILRTTSWSALLS